MRYFFIILTYIVSAFLFSCEDTPIINCADCRSEEPTNATIEVRIDDWRSLIIVEVFSGNLEDRILYISYHATGPEVNISLPVNNVYTITATYDIEGKTYVAVDSVYPRVKFSEDQCDEPCYYIYDKTVNLKLKYRD
ncbi:MAG TPA: hypothetical protein VHO50_08435 [Bacteroidales bacterium]|nr:hypothetical protein [Bacteroidales bacterium]